MYLLLMLLSFVVALAATYFLTRAPAWLNVVDYPNERSLHVVPVPRTGGLAVLLGIAASMSVYVMFFSWDPRASWMLLAASAIAAVSFLDDRFTVDPRIRLAVQFFAAGIFLIWGGTVGNGISLPGFWIEWPKPVGLICALLFVVWMTNLYNFMDGMDGFAGGMAFFGFGTFAVLGDMAGQSFFAALNFIVAAAAAGFLVFNFPPARIFMGDVGSSTLGLLAAAFALWGDSVGAFPLWIGILVFSPFIVDATATLHRRLYEGHRIWVPHKTHYYQRLVRLGWNHRRAVLAEYVLMAMSAASAFYASGASVIMQWVTIVVWGVIYVVVAATVRRYEATASGGGNASGC